MAATSGLACSGIEGGLHVVVNGPPAAEQLTVSVSGLDGRALTEGELDGGVTFPASFNFIINSRSTTRAGDTVVLNARASAGTSLWRSAPETFQLARGFTDVQLQLQPSQRVENPDPNALDELADRLVFVSAPQDSVRPGTCSGGVRVELRDAQEQPVVASLNVPVTVTGTPSAELFLFADEGCTTPLSDLYVASGSTQAQFFFRSTRLGVVTLSVASAGLMGAAQPQEISGMPATPATGIGFASETSTLRAGECSPLTTVRLLDASGNPTTATAPVTVTLGSNPAGRLSFYSDAACTTSIPSAAVASGSGQASFHFKGLGGPIIGGVLAPTELTATAPSLSAGALQHSILPVVRRGTCALANGAATTNCVVSPAQVDVNKTLLLFQATSAADGAGGANVRCVLTNASAITCSRSGTGGTASVSWQTAELVSGLTVQRPPEINCSGTSPLDVPISSVNPGSTFLLVSREGGGEDNSGSSYATARLRTSTSVRLTTADNVMGRVDCKSSLQVVSMNGITVARDESTAITAAAREETELASANTNSSALLFTLRSPAPVAATCERSVRGEVNSTTSVRFTRTSCTNSDIEAIAWERINFGNRASVQQRTSGTLNAGADTIDVTINAVDTTRTLVFASNQTLSGAGGGEGSLNNADVAGDMIGAHTLESPTLLRIKRESTQGSVRWTSFAVQLQP